MQCPTLRHTRAAAQPLARTRQHVVQCACSAQSSSSHATPAAPRLLQGKLLSTVSNVWYAHQAKQMALPAPSTPQELRAQMASAGRSCMAVLPFAAATVATGGTGGMGLAELFDALAKAIDIYLLLLTVRVLMSWFRNINWYGEPFRTLRSFTDPALNACRGIIPAIGGMDLSPMLLFFGLNFAAKQLKILAYQYALAA